MLFSVAVIEDI